MKVTGTAAEIYTYLVRHYPDAGLAVERSAGIRGQLLDYQAAALYILAQHFDGRAILEIGTLAGYSASIMAQAAPQARIVTLNSAAHECQAARKNLAGYPNVEVVEAVSWEYLDSYLGPPLGLVFVDGDHKRVERDVPWWAYLEPGGLLLFHDYSEAACPPVFKAVNKLAERLGREPDVYVVDGEGIGMAGFYYR